MRLAAAVGRHGLARSRQNDHIERHVRGTTWRAGRYSTRVQTTVLPSNGTPTYPRTLREPSRWSFMTHL